MRELQGERDGSGEGDAMRGRHLERLGRNDDALKAYRDAHSRDPNNPDVLRQLAHCQWRSSAESGEAALATIDRAIQLAPEAFLSHVIRALVLLDQRETKRAREAAEKAIELEPEESSGHTVLAQVAMREENWNAAEVSAKRALAADPDDEVAASSLAHALFCQGKQVENQVHIAAMLHQDPEDPFAHHAAGLAALQEEDFAKAETHFLEALRLDPNLEAAREGLLDAFRARSWIYRAYLRYAFFMTRLSKRQRIALLVGVIVLVQIALRSSAVFSPAVALALGALYLLFVVWTYVASSVGSLIVFGDRSARQALTSRQKIEAVLVGGPVISGCLSLGSGLLMDSLPVVAVGCGLLALSVPTVLYFKSEAKRGRVAFGSLASLGCLAVLGLLANLMWPSSTLLGLSGATGAITLVLSTWWSALGASRD